MQAEETQRSISTVMGENGGLTGLIDVSNHPPTHAPTHPRTHPPTHLPTHPPTRPPTHPLTHSPISSRPGAACWRGWWVGGRHSPYG